MFRCSLSPVQDVNILVTRDLGVALWRLLHARHVLADVVDGDPAELDVERDSDVEVIE